LCLQALACVSRVGWRASGIGPRSAAVQAIEHEREYPLCGCAELAQSWDSSEFVGMVEQRWRVGFGKASASGTEQCVTQIADCNSPGFACG